MRPHSKSTLLIGLSLGLIATGCSQSGSKDALSVSWEVYDPIHPQDFHHAVYLPLPTDQSANIVDVSWAERGALRP